MLVERTITPSHAATGQTAPFYWWFLPSWLGLDAPCVVLTWTWAISRFADVDLPLRPASAMFLVVWCIYLADRLIDVGRCVDWEQATGRLQFGRRYQWLFWSCLACALTGVLLILAIGLPQRVLQRAMLVAIGVSCHFLLFVVPLFLRRKLPGKELGVGLFFALGAYACLGVNMASLPLLGSMGLVVAFNCLVIAARDAASDLANDPGNASRWWRTMNRDLPWLGAGCAIISGLAVLIAPQHAFFLSPALAFTLLTLLQCCAHNFSGDAVRALADFALLTPLLLFLL